MSLRYVLLAFLSYEPNTGYGIGRLLDTQLNHLWEARLQQIYSELAKLEERGQIVSESIDLPNRPAKKIYTLTATGHEALDDWLEQPPARAASKNDLLVKIYCMDRISTPIVLRRLEERRDESESAARSTRDKLSELRPGNVEDLGLLLTLEAALSASEANAAWCDRAIEHIREFDLTKDSGANVRTSA